MEIQHQDLSVEIYKRLKSMILSNELEAGSKLRQEHIASLFGVSRMPLHRAFQMLESELLVESIPRKGFYVTTIDNSQLLDAFECREVFEGIAARRFALTITKEQVDYLRSLFNKFVDAEEINETEYLESDQLFHNIIIKNSGNYVIDRLELLGHNTVRTFRGGLLRSPKETLAEHFQIIDALENRESDLAENLIRAHSQKSMKILKNHLLITTK
jgi:DNA-binding GntR family transcriptional regulator